MELRHLRYLVAVADAGSFVAAAQQLRVAQPALTRQLHDLEHVLGVALFEKGARKATLTAAGQATARIARHVIEDTERALQRARMSSAGLAGECVLVAGPFLFQAGFVGRLVARMKARFPGIELVVLEGEGYEMWDRIANGRADVGVSLVPPTVYQSLMAETQFYDAVEYALVAPDHPLAKRSEATVAQLNEYPFLTFERIGTAIDDLNRHYYQALARMGVNPEKVRQLPSLNSIMTHVRAGQGWMMIPTSVRERFSPLVCVHIADFKAPYPVARMWRRSDDRPVIRTVVAELRAMAVEDREGKPTPPGGTSRARISGTTIPARLELRHLRSFAQVARFGSFGRAAQALEITQPALSRQMKDVEYDVGVTLFARGTRGVELTAAGQEFLENVKGVLAVVDHLDKEARRAERGLTQRCVIGVVPHPAVDQLVAWAVSRLESQPDRVRLGTRMIGTPTMPAALDRSEIDIALAFAYPTSAPGAPHLAHIALYDDELDHAMLSPSHPLAKSRQLSLADLADVPLLFPDRATFPSVYDAVMHQFQLAGFRPRIEATYEGAITIWAMAEQGLGWAPGLKRQAGDPPMGLVSIPLRDFSMPWGGELVYRKDEARAPVLATIDCIVARARELFGTPSRPGGAMPPAQ